MSIFDVFKASQIKEENENLKKFVEEIGGNDALALRSAVEELEKKLASLNEEIARRSNEIRALDAGIAEKETFCLCLMKIFFLRALLFTNRSLVFSPAMNTKSD